MWSACRSTRWPGCCGASGGPDRVGSAEQVHVVESSGLIHAVRLVDGRPVDLLAEPVDRPLAWGAVLSARVLRRDAGGRGGWVDLGALGETRPAWVRPARPGAPTLPNPGDRALVQVTADARSDKGCEVTLDVALPGRFLVYRPFGDGVAGSRSLGKQTIRQMTSFLADRPGGWILRRAAGMAEGDDMIDEADRLTAAWETARRRPETEDVVLSAPGVALRMILDVANPMAIIVPDPAGQARVKRQLRQAAPPLSDRVHRETSDVLEHLPDLESPIVPLSRGGSVAIEETRALTAIDVDAGGAGDLLAVNREAAAQVGRHLRLRNIGGTVVVDFVTMRRPKDAAGVLGHLRHALDGDPAQVHLSDDFGQFGLVALARQRRGLCYADVVHRARIAGEADR